MNHILKRLELIKTAIILENEEAVVKLQIDKIISSNLDKQTPDPIPFAKVPQLCDNSASPPPDHCNNTTVPNMNKKRKRGLFRESIDSVNNTLNTFNNSLRIINTELEKSLLESRKEHVKFLEKQLNDIMKSSAPKEMAKYILDIDLTDEDIEQWRTENNKAKMDS